MVAAFELLIYLLAGIGIITAIDALGSITSRKLNFNYGYFSILSFIAYTAIAYKAAIAAGDMVRTLLVVILLGFYDGIFGSEIAKRLNANFGKYQEYADSMTTGQKILSAVLFAIICGSVGFFLAQQ